MDRRRRVEAMIDRLSGALGDRLVSVVLYGPEAHGDTYRAISPLHLMIVCADLEPGTLGLLAAPVRWWLSSGQPWPRLFTPALIRDSLDVFPMEFLDISRHRRVLRGIDPLADVRMDASLLRLQCERELREKLMRLREGYVESRTRRELERLLAASYASFALVWRGYLHLLGREIPAHDREVASALCARLGLDAAPFDDVARIAAGTPVDDAEAVFARYYRQLDVMAERIDGLVVRTKGSSS